MNAPEVVARLRELDARSGGRRVAWGPEWREERERFVAWLREHVPGVDIKRDPAGNLWARRAGESDETVVIGSHLDCVPDGGWLDGCLGVLAAAEVMRSLDTHRRSIALVDWADEEGARFGHSLLGSSAACGLLDAPAAGELRDADGVRLADALRRQRRRARGDGGRGGRARRRGRLRRAAHRAGAGARRRGDGVLRGRRLPGRAPHGDPLHRPGRARGRHAHGPARRSAAGGLRVRAGGAAAARSRRTGWPPSARCGRSRGRRRRSPTGCGSRSTSATATCVRSSRSTTRARPRPAGRPTAPSGASTRSPSTPSSWSGRARRPAGGRRLTSGPLHDAAAVARAGVPTVMVFARTLGGTSHSREEDAREEDLVASDRGLRRAGRPSSCS